MRTHVRRRPSPAIVVAVVALVAALGGTAVAAKKIGGSDIKKNAIKRKHVKDDAIRTEHVKDANITASKLSDEAQAYARVNQPGTVVSQAKGVVGVNRNATGRYCLDLSFTPNIAVASIDQSTAVGGATVQTLVPAHVSCPAPFTDATVFTFGPANNAANNGFYVQFD
jgi:hypothetical protein